MLLRSPTATSPCRDLLNAGTDGTPAARLNRKSGSRHGCTRAAGERCGIARSNTSSNRLGFRWHRGIGHQSQPAYAKLDNYRRRSVFARCLHGATWHRTHAVLLWGAHRGAHIQWDPPGNYALAILHATGVAHPQQISIILASAPGNQWQLAGLYAKPMLLADHDGVWYWASARKFTETKENWPAALYFRIAQNLLGPVDFLTSPNLEKLQQETDQARPGDLPGKSPLMLNVQGSTFEVTSVDTTTQFGPLDIDLHYTPNSAQVAQLRVPVSARQQVTEVMSGLLREHPELKQAFHGIWIHADQGNASLFAIELPMDQIPSGPQPQAANAPPSMR